VRRARRVPPRAATHRGSTGSRQLRPRHQALTPSTPSCARACSPHARRVPVSVQGQGAAGRRSERALGRARLRRSCSCTIGAAGTAALYINVILCRRGEQRTRGRCFLENPPTGGPGTVDDPDKGPDTSSTQAREDPPTPPVHVSLNQCFTFCTATNAANAEPEDDSVDGDGDGVERHLACTARWEGKAGGTRGGRSRAQTGGRSGAHLKRRHPLRWTR
jgi:hypothetical protein